MKRIATLLVLAASLCFVLAWELWTPDQVPELAPVRAVRGDASVAPPPGFDTGVLNETADTVARRPLFNPDRRPVDRPESMVTIADNQVPRLAGVIVGPSGARAIFSIAEGKSRTAAPGETIGGYTVREIAPGRVIIISSEGERVLHPTYVMTSGVKASGPTKAGAR